MAKCPTSGLVLPQDFIENKISLKHGIEILVDKAINDLKDVRENYFLTIHAKFDDEGMFCMNVPKATLKLPPFVSNSMVFWICPIRGIKELLWMVPPVKKGEKLAPEFNKEGVAYLQVKGAMAS